MLRLRQPIERALRDADLHPKDIDSVILIGGATKMPIIRTSISRMFGKIPYTNINPDEAVALGTAIQVALKERNTALEEVILTDVCPYSLGVNVAERMNDGQYASDYFLPIILFFLAIVAATKVGIVFLVLYIIKQYEKNK